MAKVIEPAPLGEEFARYRHTECGALIEFTKADVRSDQRDGDYVVCPACKKVPWISTRALVWERRKS